MKLTRRDFLNTATRAGMGLALGSTALAQRQIPRAPQRLSERFTDLPRHFVFEYYPWYSTSPWRHWDGSGRTPPVDLASNYMPRLGAYDSGSRAVVEQHARWIKQSGAGAINVSWWGRDSDVDGIVPMVMDVMSDYDIHVTFHLEPYADDRSRNYARDIEYLLREYGDRRSWDCFLLLADADGTVGPVFKSFATILSPQGTDCHGNRFDVRGYTPDAAWRTQTDRVRKTFASDFDHVTLLADSLDVGRTAAGGFDGIAIFDNFVEPGTWAGHARNCTARHLLFSFNINPGFDGIEERHVEPDSCYSPPQFEPGRVKYDWARADQREQALRAGGRRMEESFQTTLALQTSPQLSNAPRGFFLTYINSFNEWHEGDQFEPMKDRDKMTAEETAIGYHNAANGAYRLETLAALLSDVLE